MSWRMETGMARLRENGAVTFVILDAEPLYSQHDVARIAKAHAIEPAERNALWRQLEAAGRAYFDQSRLSRTARPVRVRQDLQLARRLAAQLADLTPEAGQTASDTASVGLSRVHLAALREGERRTRAEGGYRLDQMRDVLSWLGEVCDAALEASHGDFDAEMNWRQALTGFYTRSLGRAWTGPDGCHGERFLADCRAVLASLDDPAPQSGEPAALTVVAQS